MGKFHKGEVIQHMIYYNSCIMCPEEIIIMCMHMFCKPTVTGI